MGRGAGSITGEDVDGGISRTVGNAGLPRRRSGRLAPTITGPWFTRVDDLDADAGDFVGHAEEWELEVLGEYQRGPRVERVDGVEPGTVERVSHKGSDRQPLVDGDEGYTRPDAERRTSANRCDSSIRDGGLRESNGSPIALGGRDARRS